MIIKMIDYGYKHAPYRAHFNDAGADVYAMHKTVIPPHTTTRVSLGFGIALPDGYMACVYPRTGWSASGVTCELPPIDSGYTGEITAIVSNLNEHPVTIPEGSRVGQLVVTPVVIARFVSEEEFENETKRGAGAFGSTGM